MSEEGEGDVEKAQGWRNRLAGIQRSRQKAYREKEKTDTTRVDAEQRDRERET